MLRGRVALITGAGRGVGAATARAFGREGARLVLNDLDAAVAEQSAAAIKAAGGDAVALPGSVMDDALHDQLIKAALDAYGGPPDVHTTQGLQSIKPQPLCVTPFESPR